MMSNSDVATSIPRETGSTDARVFGCVGYTSKDLSALRRRDLSMQMVHLLLGDCSQTSGPNSVCYIEHRKLRLIMYTISVICGEN